MNIGEWLRLAKERIDALDAELILLAGLKEELPAGVDRSYLFAHPGIGISQAKWLELDRMVERRAKGEPLAYILGYREFYGRNFMVNSDVLIPRSETEGVVDLALKCLSGATGGDLHGFQAKALCEGGLREKGLKTAKKGVQEDLRILEVGTGSGCIAVTLALELAKKGFSDVKMVATDLSAAALAVARENARNFGAEVEFLQSDLLEKMPEISSETGAKAMKFDLLVANLPYVNENWAWLDHKSLDFEPKMALYASEHGLGAYRRLLKQIMAKKLSKTAVLEIDPCQRLEMREMARKYGFKVVCEEGYGAVLEV